MINIIVHRGTHEIGGSCVELSTAATRLLIDAGTPLPQSEKSATESEIPDSLAASLRRSSPPIKGILISHAHQDHYGLIGRLSSEIPVHSSKGTAILMRATCELHGGAGVLPSPKIFENRKRFCIGDFNVTPFLVDHSAMDAYAFLVQTEGKNIFYTGDFREHGRKPALLDGILSKLPPIDVLLMEGTIVGQDREAEAVSEDGLEIEFRKSIQQTSGAVFVTLSGQNIDRIVTVFRAAKRAERTLVVDPYIAEILDRLQEVSKKIPHPSWNEVCVCYPHELCRWLEKNGAQHISKRFRRHRGSWKWFSENQSKLVMLVRPSCSQEVEKYFELSRAKWIYSMWQGYIERDKKLNAFKKMLNTRGTAFEYLHTSGHASVETLKKVVFTTKPKSLIPVHTFHPARYSDIFPDTEVLDISDGKELTL